ARRAGRTGRWTRPAPWSCCSFLPLFAHGTRYIAAARTSRVASQSKRSGVRDMLDERLATLEGLLGRVERHAKTMLGTVRALRRQAAHGDLVTMEKLFRDAPRQVEQVGAALTEARDGFSYDAEAEFASGTYTAELLAAAREHGLVLVERDGRLTAF